MRNLFIRRLCIMLAFLLVFDLQPVLVHATAQDVLNSVRPERPHSQTIKVDAGQKFYIGDTFCFTQGRSFSTNQYVPICSMGAVVVGSRFKLSCTSSKPSVATVQKTTGLVETKKKGTTVITVKVGKAITYTVTLQVQKKGTLIKTSTLKSLNKIAAKFDSRDTATVQKALVQYKEKMKELSSLPDEDPSLCHLGGFRGRNWGMWGNLAALKEELVVPMGARYAYFETTYDPLLDPSENSLARYCRPKKVTAVAGSKYFTVTFSKGFTTSMFNWLKVFEEPYKKTTSTTFYTKYLVDATAFTFPKGMVLDEMAVLSNCLSVLLILLLRTPPLFIST